MEEATQTRAASVLARVATLLRARKKLLGWSFGLFAFYSLSLGLIAPWVIQSQLQQLLQERLQLQLQTRKFNINPYALSLNIEGLQISGQGPEQPLGFEQLYVNFQLSSLWRWAWSFNEVHLLGLQGQLVRNKDGSTNFSPLIERWNASAPSAPEPQSSDADEDESAARLWIDDLQIQLDKFVLDDLTRRTPYHTQLGPISLSAQALSSLPNTTGQQHFSLHTPEGLDLSWSGSISLQPLASNGQLQLRGPLLHLASDYLQDLLNFSIPAEDFSLGFDYQLAQAAKLAGQSTAPLSLKLSQITLKVNDLQLLDRSQQPLLKLKRIALSKGQLAWPEQQVKIPSIALGKAELWLARDSQGQINFSQLLQESATEQAEPDNQSSDSQSPDNQSPDKAQDKPWHITNSKFSLSNWQLHFADQAVPGGTQLTLADINLTLNNLGNLPEQQISYTSELKLGQGQLQSQGQLQLQPLANIQAQLSASQLPIKLAQTYVQTQAKVLLKSGELSFSSQINGLTPEQLVVDAQLELANLEVDEQSSERPILAWSKLSLSEIQLALQNKNLSLAQITLDKLFADFAIAADGSTSIDRVLIADAQTAKASEQTAKANEQSAIDPSETPWQIQLGKTQLNNASGVFSDDSLPLPFKAQIQQLNGYITRIDSSENLPATLKMKGQVAPYGQLEINGKLLPLDPQQLTQIKLLFRNLDIPEFSPYSIKFAGRKIASGKMDLDLNYDIQNKAMKGSNNLVLKDFTLGERVEQPGAMDLPLDLAIALLKDSQGKINADLPVSGKLDDPQFNYGKVVGQALTSMLSNLVTAPFKMLGSLLGLGKDENLGSIQLNLGSAELAPPEQEKLNKLAQALAKRPQLQVQIAGIFQRQLDGQALAREAILQSLREELKNPNAELDSNDKKQLKLLEAMYQQQGLLPRLIDLQQSLLPPDTNSAADAGQSPASKKPLDQSRYYEKILISLAAAQPAEQSLLEQLAQARAQAISDYLQQAGLGAERIELLKSKALKAGAKQTLQLKLKLTQTKAANKSNQP